MGVFIQQMLTLEVDLIDRGQGRQRNRLRRRIHFVQCALRPCHKKDLALTRCLTILAVQAAKHRNEHEPCAKTPSLGSASARTFTRMPHSQRHDAIILTIIVSDASGKVDGGNVRRGQTSL